MRPLARFASTAVALALVFALAAPLQAARCRVGTDQGCPLMRGAAGSLCHRAGAVGAPMDCCKTKGSTAPAPAAERIAAAAPLAVLPAGELALVAVAAPAALRSADAGRERAAAELYELGLFILLAVLRN